MDRPRHSHRRRPSSRPVRNDQIPTGRGHREDDLRLSFFDSVVVDTRSRQENELWRIDQIERRRVHLDPVPGIVFANHVTGEHSDYLQGLINEDIDRKPAYHIDLKDHYGYHFTSIYPKLGPDGYLYLFGEASFDADGIKLARVPANQIEQAEAYEYLINYDQGQPIYARGAQGRLQAHVSEDNYVIKEKSREISSFTIPI
jgi:hypothetical protein